MPDTQDDRKIELNEMMLAMDVVDTLRYQYAMVERELESDHQDQALIEKVRGIYASQGIDVTDEIIAQGVAALREDRFVYRPPKGGLKLKLARIYVNRGRWAKISIVFFTLIAVGYLVYHFTYTAPQQKAQAQIQAFPQQLAQQRNAVVAEAREDGVSQQAENIYRDGMAALKRNDVQAARDRLTSLGQLYDRVVQAYTLRIVSRPEEPSGVWRIPKANPNGRNFYLIVEAVTQKNNRLTLPVTSEEDGQTRMVNKWGVRVDASVFDRIKRDKQQDGIVNENILADKKRGYLKPDYRIMTIGGAITQW